METHKTAILNARIEPALKKSAEKVLHTLGLTNAEAIRLFYKQICLHKGLPFPLKVPNKTTVKAMQAADNGDTFSARNVDELFDDLDD